MVVDGALTVTVGGVLSIVTLAVVLLTPAELPALSEAVPAGSAKLNVPSPLIPVKLMVRVAPLPVIFTFPILRL